MKRWQILLAVATVAACGDNKAPDQSDARPVDAGIDKVARGRYLVNNVAACPFCHTPLNPDGSRDLTRELSGIECLVGPQDGPGIGCLNSRNLTNDPTGLMFATDAQIKYAFQNGVRTDGHTMVPVMPYDVFANMTDDDADSIVAYLRTVPGVNHQVPVNEAPWILWNLGPCDPMFDPMTMAPNCLPPNEPLDKSLIPMPTPTYANQAAALRGRYLAGQAGLCIDCHTSTDDPGMVTLDPTKFFAGGRMFPSDDLGLMTPPYPAVITSANLTPDPTTGLGAYTLQQIKDAISVGKDPTGHAVCAATHGGVTSPYAGLTPGDLDDIGNFIASLPPIVNAAGMDSCQGPLVP